jgi:uncharacterized damage-inducible protein DinB
MRIDDIQFVFGYDRWATVRILEAAAGVDEETWSASDAIDGRGLGAILVHQLGASQRWRHHLSDTPGSPRPERDPLPSIEALRASWDREWEATDIWLDTVEDAFLARTDEDIPFWQLLLHVINHGTQHRSEVAVLLTAAGHSPGDLDLADYSEALVAESAS